MNDTESGCAFGALIWIVTIVISIGVGILAWNLIKPESFFGAIGFLIIWGVLSRVGYFIATAIMALFDN